MEEMDAQPSNRRRNIIIGVVAVVVIVAVVIGTTRGLTPSDSGATEQTVLGALQADVSNLQTWKAETAEKVANIETDISNIESPSYSADIDALYSQLEAVQNDILNLSYQTVGVTRIEGEYVDVTTYQEGPYPIILMLYGSDLTNVEARFSTVAGLWGGNQTMTAVITGTWTMDYVIELKITGTVQYACAIIGAGKGTSEPEW